MDKIATIEASLAEAKKKAEEVGGKDETLNTEVKSLEAKLEEVKNSQDPIKQELDRVQKKFSKKERLEFAKKKIDEQLKEFGDEEDDKSFPDDKDAPVTVGMLEAREKKEAQKTALQLAEAIEEENERELVKHYLKDRIVPSGNAAEDLKLARAAINSLKHSQIAEEAVRARNAKGNSSSPGAPTKPPEANFEPTPQEKVFMAPPYNLSKEDIVKARDRAQE